MCYKKLSYMESPDNGVLPGDIMLEILSSLPVKSLMRFKCVCKQWYTIIGSPSFVNRHFCHENNQERLHVSYYKSFKHPHVFGFCGDGKCSGYEEPDHLQVPYSVTHLIGPVNGVFCVLSESGDLALLNPAMRQFKPIHFHCPSFHPHSSIYDHLVGFVFDQLSGEYKVFSLRYFPDYETRHRYVSIYSSGSDSWRHIENVDLVKFMCRAGRYCSTCLNGVYYRITLLDDGSTCTLLALDMSGEKYKIIQVPDCIKYILDLRIALYGDTIALLSYNDTWVNVWEMKEEGCWTRSLILGPIEDIRRAHCFWKNNELVVETKETSLTLCNVSTLKLRTVEARKKEQGWYIYRVSCYKESLVSIKREGDNCRLWDASSDFVKNFFAF